MAPDMVTSSTLLNAFAIVGDKVNALLWMETDFNIRPNIVPLTTGALAHFMFHGEQFDNYRCHPYRCGHCYVVAVAIVSTVVFVMIIFVVFALKYVCLSPF